MQPNPILVRELRTQLRGVRSTVLISTFVGLLIAALIFMYRTVEGRVGLGTPLLNAQIGQALWSGMALLLQTLVIFIAPAITVSAISTEYEQRTFDFVVMTPVRAERVLLGKLLGALAYLLVLLCSVIPLFSAVLLFGGVRLIDVGRAATLVAITAIFGIMFGLFCSSLLRRTASATILCYTLLVALIGGTLFAASFWSITHSQASAPPAFVYANPLSGMASILALTPNADPNAQATNVSPDTLRPLALVGVFSQGTRVAGAKGSVQVPVYRATSVIFALLTLALFWASIHVVQPDRGRRITRADIVLLALFIAACVVAYLSRGWWMSFEDIVRSG